MRNVNYAAVRAFNRVIAPHSQASDEAMMADAHFDGGEWSGPAHARIWQDIELEVANKVASRFNMEGKELLNHVYVAEHLEHERFMDVMVPSNHEYTCGQSRDPSFN